MKLLYKGKHRQRRVDDIEIELRTDSAGRFDDRDIVTVLAEIDDVLDGAE